MGTNLKPIRTSRSSSTLRIVLLGDTHQLHREVEVPDGDILIHAGDFTMFSKSMNAITGFNAWLGELHILLNTHNEAKAEKKGMDLLSEQLIANAGSSPGR